MTIDGLLKAHPLPWRMDKDSNGCTCVRSSDMSLLGETHKSPCDDDDYCVFRCADVVAIGDAMQERAWLRECCENYEADWHSIFDLAEGRGDDSALEAVSRMGAELESMRETFTSSWCPGGKASIGFEALGRRVVEADRKHPRDLHDGVHAFRDRAAEELDDARDNLARAPSWLRALRCEVAEAAHELVVGNYERLADELLDVATVALRWRRAILERTKTGE